MMRLMHYINGTLMGDSYVKIRELLILAGTNERNNYVNHLYKLHKRGFHNSKCIVKMFDPKESYP
jgi:hypothetical protein